MQIRAAREAELSRLMEIRDSVIENRLSDPGRVVSDDYRWFCQHAPIRVAEVAGTVQGFGACDPRNGSVWALFVDPDHAGQGLGTALLSAICADLRRHGHSQAWLSTETGSRAQAFYQRRGWHLAPGTDADAPEVRLERPLTP